MKKLILILMIVAMAFSGFAMPIPNVGKSPPPENTTIISTVQANPVVVAIVSPSFDIAPALPFIMFGHSELQATIPIPETTWYGPTCGHNNMMVANEEATRTDPIVREKRFLGAGDSPVLGYAELTPLAASLCMSVNSSFEAPTKTSQATGDNTAFCSLKRFLGAGDRFMSSEFAGLNNLSSQSQNCCVA
jgi:hypothetical protein